MLLLWIPLRQKPGIGTVSNVIVVGLAADAGLALIPEGGPLSVRLTMLTAARARSTPWPAPPTWARGSARARATG